MITLRLYLSRFALLALSSLAMSCGETTSNAPSQLNLDRPSDMTFACHGGLRLTNGGPATADQQIVTTAQPTTSCDVRSRNLIDDVQQRPVGQEDLSPTNLVGPAFWYSFILQRGPGTVAIANFQTKPATAFAGADVTVLDTDPLTPGKNGISVGEDPVAIATDKSGCKVLTANAGSCDLSVLDINSALDTSEPEVDVQRLEVKNADGSPIRSKPAAMAFEPATSIVGNACPATATGIAYIAYPSCHMVAAVDVSTGTLVSAIQYDAAGVPTIVTGNISCPDECGGGGLATDGVRPVTVDLEYDPREGVNTRRLAIGSDNAAAVAIVELDAVTTLPLSVRQIALEENVEDLGVTQVAMSQQVGMGGQSGFVNDSTAPGGQRQFVYAIATDDTVRVVDVLNDVECDTNVDPRFLKDIRSVRDLSCLVAGDPTTPPRRAGSRGPGIELTNEAVPTSVDIIRSEAIENDSRLASTPGKLVGHFAVITATNGGVFVANVDDDDFRDLYDAADPLAVPIPLAIAHQLRDAVGDRGVVAENADSGLRECENLGPLDSQGVAGAGPRAANPPQRAILSASIAVEKATQLPYIRQELCQGDVERAVSELTFPALEATRALVFPDIRALRGDEIWSMTWEGSLSDDNIDTAIDGPVIRESEMYVDSVGIHLVDQTKPYCEAGVEPWDVLQMRGCDPTNGNIDCPLNYRCFVHPQSQVQGIGACMLDEEADRLAEACKDYLLSVRRYTIGRTEEDELILLPRRHTLRTTPLQGCTDDAQCQSLADYQQTLARSEHPSLSTAEPAEEQYKCLADPYRAPNQTGKQCAMVCEDDADCVTGTVCDAGICMEGVTPPQSCVNAPQRYELRAGEAFTVIGSRSGYVHSVVADANGQCVKDPDAHPLQVGRIPLDPPACDPTADPETGALPGGGFDANPCLTTVKHTEPLPRYVPGTCNLDSPASQLVERDAQAVRFRNRSMTFNMVDPTYPGDQTCITDRQGPNGMPLVGVPHVYGGYQVAWRVVAGFQPLGIPVSPAFPVKVVRGPTQSIWVIDEGDFLSTSVAQPSTRGKVFRIEPHSLGLINVLE